MAVMTKMRELTKVILYTLVVAFVGTIIFDWGMNYTGRKTTANVIGKVNGEEISARQFDQTYAAQLEQYRNQTGNDITDRQIDLIRNQVWESLVQDFLIQEALAERDIRAEDDEIVYRLFNAPPEILKANPSFQNDKKEFDMAKYQSAINNPNTADQWRSIEEYLRQTLPYEKFQQRLQASVRVTDDEIRREYLKRNQRVTVEYVFVDPARFSDDDFEITDAMINAYYAPHREDYKQEEKRSIEYVVFATSTTAADSAEQIKLADRILNRVQTGEDFAEMAEIYSEDAGSKDKGGDLGFFGKGAMVKEFEQAAFSAKPGEIIGPVETQFGIHIIKVEEKRQQDGKEEVKARHILFKFEPSQKTINTAKENAEYVAKRTVDISLAKLAAETGDSVQTTGMFIKGSGFIPGIGLNQRMSNFIFANGVGSVGSVAETSQGFQVYRITEIDPEHVRPLDEVRALVKNKLMAEKKMDKAGQAAEKTYGEINNGVSFEDAAAKDSLVIKKTSPFNRAGFVSGVGRDPKFIGAAFALEEPGSVSKPVTGTRGYYLLKLVEKDPFDEKDFGAQKSTLASQLLQRRKSQVFSQWYADAKAQATIDDYRDRYFN